MSTPAAKKRRWVSDVPICPIYKATEPQCVFCDASEISSISSIRISFPNKQKRVDYMEKYCEKNYQDCVVWAASSKKEK